MKSGFCLFKNAEIPISLFSLSKIFLKYFDSNDKALFKSKDIPLLTSWIILLEATGDLLLILFGKNGYIDFREKTIPPPKKNYITP